MISRFRNLGSTLLVLASLTLSWGGMAVRPAYPHFLVLLPGEDVVEDPSRTEVTFEIQFTHPMDQGPIMPMGEPEKFFVVHRGNVVDLKSTLVHRLLQGQSAYLARYRLKEPGDHVFVLVPAPYWEALEGKWIVHYTKVVVNFLGEEGGWEKPVGLPVEIQPLTRPYGLWAGNCFRGVVLYRGRPVPFARVEIEYWNANRSVEPPNGSLVTQVVKADGQGVFCYAIPWAGWWGFAALVEGEETRPSPEGRPAEVELGGLIWVRAVEAAPAPGRGNRP